MPAKRTTKQAARKDQPRPQRVAKLPDLLSRKIYKTGQTRGADDDEIFQNRVSRNSTVLIPYSQWKAYSQEVQRKAFTKGYIVLVPPTVYFDTPESDKKLREEGLELGKNALVFFEKRSDWERHNPDTLKWKVATSREANLGGRYVARIAANTGKNGEKIVRGFTSTSNKGAGVRVYEYAGSEAIADAGLQLEALFWMCEDSTETAVAAGMQMDQAEERRQDVISRCESSGLLDIQKLREARIVDADARTVCPLCLARLSSVGFITKQAQAPGREVHDLTITQLNLFHIRELRFGEFNHKPYNLGWGHHHCNVVVKDAGIQETLEWMRSVLQRNGTEASQSASDDKEA